jgi:hypothetical protein
VLAKIRSWFSEARRWRNGNVRSWGGHDEPGPDGLSRFQHETEARLRATLSVRGHELGDLQVLGRDEKYIVARVPEAEATVWVYRDGTEIQSPGGTLRLERWDARTPEEHRDKVVEFLDSLLERSNKR